MATRTRKTQEQKVAELEARLNRERAKLTATKRKQDTRRKIIAGALALEHAEINTSFGNELKQLINRHVTRKQDRKLFGLEELQGD